MKTDREHWEDTKLGLYLLATTIAAGIAGFVLGWMTCIERGGGV